MLLPMVLCSKRVRKRRLRNERPLAQSSARPKSASLAKARTAETRSRLSSDRRLAEAAELLLAPHSEPRKTACPERIQCPRTRSVPSPR